MNNSPAHLYGQPLSYSRTPYAPQGVYNNWNNNINQPTWYPGWNNNEYPYWDNNWNNNPSPNLITIERAINIALQRVPGQVVKAELDTENGRMVYEVDIRTPQHLYEVKVDAHTGQILRVEIED